MSYKLKISVLTGTRADYGLLRILMLRLQENSEVELETIVTGTHFLPEFGNTWEEIVRDGLPITHKVDIFTDQNTSLAVAQSTGTALSLIAEVLNKSKPDLLVVLGDRFESHAGAEAAFLLGIPVAHIAGGEKTEGALDEILRHSITKFSSLHFVAAEEYKNRVIQLGENPNSVHNVGAIGLDSFVEIPRMSPRSFSDFVGFELSKKPFILCTMHPETVLSEEIHQFVSPLIRALESFPQMPVLFTRSNADAGGRKINQLLDELEAEQPSRFKVVPSLGQQGYISALELADVVVGNSSSGILEAPTAGTPTVNIGDRQKGRLRAPSVIDVKNDSEQIIAAIKKSLTPEFQELSLRKQSPFGVPGASNKIINQIMNTNLVDLLPKSFYDLPSGVTS